MGEIADMMLDGTMCEMCGVFLDGESSGFPRYCSKECAKDRGADFTLNKTKRQPQDVISIKVTYNGNKVFYATVKESTFQDSVDIGALIARYLKQYLEVSPRYTHPKLNDLLVKDVAESRGNSNA